MPGGACDVRRTIAPTTGRPCASLTIPTSAPVSDWPDIGRGARKRINRNSRTRRDIARTSWWPGTIRRFPVSRCIRATLTVYALPTRSLNEQRGANLSASRAIGTGRRISVPSACTRARSPIRSGGVYSICLESAAGIRVGWEISAKRLPHRCEDYGDVLRRQAALVTDDMAVAAVHVTFAVVGARRGIGADDMRCACWVVQLVEGQLALCDGDEDRPGVRMPSG